MVPDFLPRIIYIQCLVGAWFCYFQKEICTSNMLYNERVCNTLTDLDIHFVHKQSLADKCALKCKKIIGTNKYV